MEMEVGNTDVGQVKVVGSEDAEREVEEKMAVGLHGPKESGGDDVFEEAVGGLIPEIDSGDKVVSDDKSSGEVGDLGGDVGVHQMLVNGEEVEKFEETVGVSGKFLNLVAGVEQKEEAVVNVEVTAPEAVVNVEVTAPEAVVDVEDASPAEVPDGERESVEDSELLVSEVPWVEEPKQTPGEILNGGRESGENADVLVPELALVDEYAAPDEVLVNGGEELKVDEIVENGEHELRNADVETSNSIEEDEVNEMSDELLKKPANGVMHDLKVDLIQDGIDTDEKGKQIHGRPETQEANEVKGGYTDSGQEVGSNGDIVHRDATSIEENEVFGTPDTSHKENRSIELADNAASWSFGYQGDSNDVKHDSVNSDVKLTKDQMQELEREQQQSILPENQGIQEKEKDIPAILTPVMDHQGSFTFVIDQQESSMFVIDQQESPTFVINRQESSRSVINRQESSTSVINQHESLRSENGTYSSVGETPKKHGAEGFPMNLSNSSVEERGKAPMAEELHTSQDALAKEVSKVLVSSSDYVVESSGGSQPQLCSANGGVAKVSVDHPGSKRDDEEAKQSLLSNKGQEAKPAMDNSSTVRSAPSPAPSPAPAPRPAGLGRAAPLLESAPRVAQQPRVNGSVSATQNQLVEEPANSEAEEYDETREKLQMIRVKFLRLAHRLGQTPHNVVVAQVLYRLGLAEQLRGRSGGRVAAFSFDRASAMAEQLEAAGQEPLDFSCTIMVLGKTGVGKSATINSIFDEVKFGTDAFQCGTKKVQDVIGTVQGIKVRVIDTPGLLPSWSDQRQNERILHSVKRFIKKTPPDIVLYLDRLDMQSRDFGDMPLLRTITDIFGPSIWFNAIVVLTHAASAPPEGPNGATSYDMFVTQRSHAVQHAIRQAAGDMRLMNPVSLVENHSACRTNRAGQRVLPNGQVWKPHLLLLSLASKILAEANTLLKLQDSPPGRTFTTRTRAAPLPFLLSSLLQSRPQVKLPSDQFGDDESLDDDLDESSDSEDEYEYDQLPPFKSLTQAQLAKLPKDQRKAYYAELEYREKLFMKKQLKEDRKQRKMMKTQAMANELPADYSESTEEESGGAASVPVPMPDLALPATFDSDNPTHRYRCLDFSNQWLVRPVLEPNGWDHDVGYEGINVQRLFVVKDKVPFSFSGQVSKDKKDTNLQMEVATSLKHGEGKATSLGFDMQSVGKDIAYTLRGETRFINYRRNKATTGLSVTVLGDTVTGGVKVEDRLIVNKRGMVVVSGGAMFGRGDVAYGGSLEATLRDKDHPLGRFLSTLGLSVMDWHGDLAIGCNSQTQIPIGRHTNLIGRVNINNKGAGQVSIRLNSSEQLQIALVAVIPFAKKLLGYSQSQYG